MAVLPLVFFVSVRLRNLLFPLSWLVQARAAEIATIVDENVNGVRVVKGFAAEQRQVGALARAAATHAVGQRRAGRRTRAVTAPLVENLPRLGLALRAPLRREAGDRRPVTIGDLVAFNAYVAPAADPVPGARLPS